MGHRSAALAIALAAGTAWAQSTWVSPVTPVDVPVDGQSALVEFVSAASDGSDFVVAWTEQNVLLGASLGAARVSSDGGVIRLPRVNLPIQVPPDLGVAFDGSDFLAGYSLLGLAGPSVLALTPLTPSVWGTTATFSPMGTGNAPWVSVAGGQMRDLVVWADGADALDAALYSRASGQLGSVQTMGGSGSQCPVVAWTGSNYFAAWQQPTDGGPVIYGTAVFPDGGIAHPQGVAIDATPIGLDGCPALGCNEGGACLVGWWVTVGTTGGPMSRWVWDAGLKLGGTNGYSPLPPGTAQAVAVDATGAWFDTGSGIYRLSSVDGGIQAYVSVLPPGIVDAAAGTGSQSLLTAVRDGGLGISAALLSGAPMPNSSFGVYAARNSEIDPVAACGPAVCLIAWADDRPGETAAQLGSDWIALQIDPTDRTVLASDAGPFHVLSSGTLAEWIYPPAVSASASQYLFVGASLQTLSGLTRIVADRIDLDGGLLDALPLQLGTTGVSTALVATASNGTDFLVTWSSTSKAGVYATRVEPDGGTPDDPGVKLDSAGIFPAIASDGTDWLVAWVSLLPDGGDAVSAIPFFDDGGTGAAQTLDEAPSLGVAGAAFSGGTYYVSWVRTPPAGGSSLVAAALRGDGTVSRGPWSLGIPDSALASGPPQIVAAPYGIFVLETLGPDAGQVQVAGFGWKADGTLTDANPVSLFSTSYPPFSIVGPPAVLTSAPGGALVVAPSLDATADALRTYFVTLAFGAPLDAPCETGAECESGVCEAGVCCALPGACSTPPGDGGAGNGGSTDGGSADGGGVGPSRPASNLGCGCTGVADSLALVALGALALRNVASRRRHRAARVA